MELRVSMGKLLHIVYPLTFSLYYKSKLDAVLRKKSRFQGVELSRDTNAVNSGDSILPQIPSAGRQDKNKLNALNKG